MSERRVRKEKFVVRMEEYLQTYKNILIVGVDNVGSNQMQKVRIALRGKAQVLLGKNTLIRKILRDAAPKNPKLETLLPLVVGNMGFVFTNDNLNDVRKIVLESKVPAAAKPGTFAQRDVFIPPGPTGLDPGQTNFFQALNISTKIVKGAIEIVSEVHLIKKDEKVTLSHVAMLDKMNVRPFFYGFKVNDVWEDGTVYSANILDMDEQQLLGKFFNGVRHIAALSLAIHFPTAASVSHSLNYAFKQLIAVALETSSDFPEVKKFRDFLANPSAFAAAPAASAAAPAAAKPAAKKKTSSSEGGDMGFDLFN